MSSNLLPNDTIGSGSFAPIDTAFSPSSHMSDFQEKIIQRNPLAKKHNMCDIISIESEKKMANNIDEMIGTMSHNMDIARRSDRALGKKFLHHDIQGATTVPTNMSIENFDLQQNANDLYNEVNQMSYNISGMSFLRLILVLILIAAVIYLGYCLLRPEYETNYIIGPAATTTISRRFKEFFGGE